MHTFNYIVHLRNVHALVIPPVDSRQMLIYLNYYYVRTSYDRSCHAGIYRIIEVAVLIHRRHTDHDYIYLDKKLIVSSVVMKDHRDIVAKALVTEHSLILRTVP